MASTAIDKNGVELTKGSIVKFQNGTRNEILYGPDGTPVRDKNGAVVRREVPAYNQGRITRLTKKWANIGPVWAGKVFAKQIPISELEECSEAFYEAWRNSESYRCM